MADTLISKAITTSNNNAIPMLDVGSWATTVLSFTICNNQTSADVTFDVYIDDGNSGSSANYYYIYTDVSLPAMSTFEHSDKIIINTGDELNLQCSSNSGQVEAVTSALKQT